MKFKIKNIPTNIMFLVMWLVDAFYVQNSNLYFSDYMEYYNVYNGYKQNYFEVGYYYCGLLARILGLNFFWFRLIIISITLILMRDSILKYAKKPGLITLLYMIHPFLLQCIQIRNALSIAIVIYSLRYLTEENLKIKKFVICILIATLFHSSAILYFIILLDIYIRPKYIVPMSVGMMLIFEGMFGAYKNQIVQILTKITHNDKIAYYLNVDENRMFTNSMILYFIIYFMCIAVFLLFYNEKKDRSIDYILISSSIFIFSYIPIMLVHYDYFRIFEYYFPIVTMALLNIMINKGYKCLVIKIPIILSFLSITILKCSIWIIDNNNEVLSHSILFK